MALRHMDSFQYGNPTNAAPKRFSYVYTVNAVGFQTIQTTGSRFGSDRWLDQGTGRNEHGCCQITLPGTSYTRLFIQFGYKCLSFGDGYPIPILGIMDGAGDSAAYQLTVFDDANTIKLYRGDRATLLASASTATTTGAWHQLEFDFLMDQSSGAVTMKLNGVSVLTYAGDTCATANTWANSVRLGGYSVSYYAATRCGYSDLIIMDDAQVNGHNYCNSLLGVRRVLAGFPTADGAYKQWSRSTGTSGFSNVDEMPANDDTDYNYTTVVGNKDTFVMPDGPAGVTIDAVQCVIYCKAADVAAAQMVGTTKSNSVDGDGVPVVIGPSYGWSASPIYEDPATNAAWLSTAFNAAEFGYKKYSQG